MHKLLDWLHGIQPGKEVPALENPTKIREFRQLSEAAVDMGNRSYKAYEEQKQFIENASHELQTPLAIVRGKVELLAESDGLTEQQMKELDEIYSTLGRAVKLNKSFAAFPYKRTGSTESEDVSVDEILENLLPDLMDIYELKQVRLLRKQGNSLLLFAVIIRWHRFWFQSGEILLHNADGGRVADTHYSGFAGNKEYR